MQTCEMDGDGDGGGPRLSPDILSQEEDPMCPVVGASQVPMVGQERTCWFCLEELKDGDDWIAPCKCRGSMGACHHACLLKWIAVQEIDNWNNMEPILCPVCKTKYIIHTPDETNLVYLFKIMDTLSHAISTAFCTAMLLGSIYSSMTLYGALSLFQLMGYDEGFRVMKQLGYGGLIALPTIPTSLLSRAYMSYLVRCQLAEAEDEERRRRLQNQEVETAESLEVIDVPQFGTRDIAGTLLFPLFAGMGRRFLPERFGLSNLQRSLISAVAIIVAKNNIVKYLKQRRKVELSRRRILNYHEL